MEKLLSILQNLDKIIDFLLIIVLLICIWSGYKKGLIMGIGGILVIIIAVFGGHVLSNAFSYEVIPVMEPFASGYMESKLNTAVYAELGIEEDDINAYSFDDLIAQNPDIVHDVCAEGFKAIGIYDETADSLATASEAYAEDNAVSIKDAVTNVLCNRIAYVGGFLIFFLLILIVLTVIANIPNIAFKLPACGIVNDIAGAVLGLITGILFCSILVWAIQYLGILVKEEALSDHLIASLFMKKNLLAKYLGM